jgi:putative membrane protein
VLPATALLGTVAVTIQGMLARGLSAGQNGALGTSAAVTANERCIQNHKGSSAMMIYGYHMGSWSWVWMTLSSVVFWALLAGVIVLVIRAVKSPERHRSPSGTSSAERLLAERYARGEIGMEEYEDHLHTLRARVP